ncbi:acetoin:2,6-dichlorophenolindophenol oxidoreductase subunit alpha [Sphingobium jiangsuense]|uniref:Pyruvate dehydrogenase E1 component alpha subunit n=1 Tax=Sphingobium jiangsuense TaxID=870476 RepID=A0A7W6BJ22_9SPHN|nr:thiamine pyrophosphate-dependent dehydrogenase E1 component subunit alpha [Sphingobium jiangsuense]MBB3926854.1 pyruvate dehydrogenase E1 component alpha subunit [Sphingobium jiangsuense]GLS98862.1 acetoin:2,6-dichlorophenolindophenol oxidoreductase subunit alpha [Sphingobium jiangsuense]
MLLDPGFRLEIYRRMVRIRLFEEAIIAHHPVGHLSIGQEGAIVGACMALNEDDYVTGTHRSHGHPIGKGADLRPLMAEIFGKRTGICKGLGGSMHLTDTSKGLICESAIVGGGFPLATGAGLSAQVRGSGQVSMCFFGDGATNQGTFSESVNMAAIWKLPVIYFCENNGYAVTTPVSRSHGQPDIARRADGFGIPGVTVDGQDVEAVLAVTREAVSRARAGEGPTLIEARTYRFDEHSNRLAIPIKYREEEEIRFYRETRDPITLYRVVLAEAGLGDDLASVDAEVREAIKDCVAFAKDSPEPEMSDLWDNMYSNPIHLPGKPRP